MCFESQKYKQYYALVIMVLLSPMNSHLYTECKCVIKNNKMQFLYYINVSIKLITEYLRFMIVYN